MAEQSCRCSPDTALVLSCSGGSNARQVTNEVTKRRETAGLAKFFFLAGVAKTSRVEGFATRGGTLLAGGCRQ